ncbi:hypothetical protein [Spiroplasma alleghenense]|uniref:Lipoprotein n=1 Tax=Spiroplasma alleghenense TaxID=216931 RepID=A0A345Z2K4_9MOLU|nr:hypothetical protein [Spiroplasma alleghenense]AXK50833.1 hypothetical protein SALLE_v1c01570 [Spiroplasma alleghenense]
MKKLLCILGASTMVVSAPLSVISCKKTKSRVDDEFDYNRIIKEFIDEVASIFKTEISTRFNEYQFISDQQLPDELDYKTIKDSDQQFKERKGEVYDNVVTWISDLIPRDNINNVIKEEVLTNVNYNPVLIDRNTPLKDGIWIDEVNLKSQEVALTFTVKISSTIHLKGGNDEKYFESIDSYVIINVFDQEAILEQAKKIEAEYVDLINNKIANSILFLSDSGNLDKTTLEIPENEILKKYLKDEINNLKIDDGQMNDKNLSLKVVDGGIVDAGTGMHTNEFEANAVPYQTFLKALQDDQEAEQTLLENIKGNDGKWKRIESFTSSDYVEIDKAIARGEKISRALNQYGLSSHVKEESIFKRLLLSSKSSFKIDFEKDANIIAVFATELKGLSFTLAKSDFELNSRTIFIRQKITRENTLEYYDDFIQSAWEFQKTFLQAERDRNGDVIFNLRAPQFWQKSNFAEKFFTGDDFPIQELFLANEQANEKNLVFNFSQDMLRSNQYLGFARPKYIYVNKDFNIFYYDLHQTTGRVVALNNIAITTSLFPDVLKNYGQPQLTFETYNKSNPNYNPDDIKEILDYMKSPLSLKF